MTTAHLETIELPDFGMPGERPDLPAETYARRVELLRARADERGYDRLVVYADREHSANLSYLTGFDPRFEEAVLVLGPTGLPAILVGNECWGMAGAAPLPMERHRFQDLSLPSQPRDHSLPLGEILAGEGIGAGSRVGVLGWKTYSSRETMEVPAFLVDELRRLTGSGGLVENATTCSSTPRTGCGSSTTRTSWPPSSTRPRGPRTGSGISCPSFDQGCANARRSGSSSGTARRCRAISCSARVRGRRWDCSARVIGRSSEAIGSPSPSGIWGALNCRAGFVVEDAAELPEGIGDYVDKLVGPYFAAVVDWYRALHIGQTGGTLQAIIDRHLGDPFFGIFLNPGHQLHLDEWVNSPVGPGSTTELRSGMALQVDIIPATGTDYFTTNIEDGIALADQSLRDELAARYPAAWGRIEARRRFMADGLGIELHPDVLPFSNMPAVLPPFLLRPDRAMIVAD